MEAQLIEAVLSGRLSVQAALAWALGDGDEPPPIELRLGSPWRAGSGPRPALRPADFRVAALNYVREQAELVLAAAEQEAAGTGASSQPATPTPAPPPAGRAAAAAEEGGRGPPPEASRVVGGGGMQPPAPQQVQQRRASWPSGGGQRAQHTQQQQRPPSQPGRLDDDNFPTLAAAAATSGGRRQSTGRGSPSKPPPPAGPPGNARQQGGRRRTIVPAKVDSLEVNPLFQLPAAQPAAQPPPRAQQQQQQQRDGVPAFAAARSAPEAPQPQPHHPPPPKQQQPQQAQQAQQQQSELPPSPAAAATLPTSPPPIAVRLPAPGAAVAASLLLRGGGGGAAAAAAAGLSSPGQAAASPGGDGSTPKRITPIRLLQAAEVQPTFLASLPATSPRSARREMLQQPEFLQARSRPGSRLGTPLAGSNLAGASAPSPFALGSALAAAAAAAGGASAGSSGGPRGSGSGGPSSSSRSPLLWSAEEQQTVCQQLSFDTLLSPGKPAGVEVAASASSPPATSPAAGDSKKAAGSGVAVALAAHAGPAEVAPPLSTPQQAALEQRMQRLELGSGSAAISGSDAGSSSITGASSRQQRILEAAAQRMGGRMAAAGGSTSSGFDAPSGAFDKPQLTPSAVRPIELAGVRAESANPPAEGQQQAQQPPQQAQRQQQEGTAAPSQQHAAQPALAAQQQRAAPQLQQEAQPQPEQQADGQHDGPQLCAEGRRLAELHAALLRCCSAISLSAELDLLLNLLAVPTSVRIDPALVPLTRLWCGDLAQRYACCVLQGAGSLVRGLGPQLLGDLEGLPLVRAAFPWLHGEMQAALQHFAATQLHTEKAYRRVCPSGGGGILSSLQGLSVSTSDGRRTRSQEEQRRISNRESCRDEWFNLMREAAAQTHSFAARQLGRLAAGASDRLSDSGRTATTAAGGDEASLLHLMQHAATDLLRRLRPDNFAAFAELFTAAVLQAAATGETLLDEELSSLARKNVGRFHSLNQRLQAQGAAGPSRGGAARRQSNQPLTATGFGRSRSSNASLPGRLAGRQQAPARGGGGRGAGGAGGGAAGGAVEAAAESLRLVAEFPRPQRLYVLFLEAADSHRLNSHLVRCMTGKLRALTAGEHAGGGLSERVAAVSTLATFLSYLAFSRGGAHAGSGDDSEPSSSSGSSSSAAYDGSHPVDAAAALEAALAAPDGAPLAWTVPWVLRYLWFLKWDTEAAQAPYFRRLLRRLATLHGAPELRPAQQQFSLAAFCLRLVLDDFAERMGPDLMPTCTLGSGGEGGSGDGGLAAGAGTSSIGGGNSSSAAAAAGAGEGGRAAGSSAGGSSSSGSLAGLAAVDGLLDSRFLHLCCPTLDHARQLFSASSGGSTAGGQRAEQARRVKKIRPTAPSGTAAARAALAAAPSMAAAQPDGSRDLLKLQLQRAFLEQYSTDEHKVKLRDVVDYVSDILAYNSATSAAGALLPAAADTIAEQLKEAAAAAQGDGHHEQQVQQQPQAQAQQAQQAQQPVDPSTRLYLEAVTEQLIAKHTAEVLQQAREAAERQIRAGAVQAMAALSAPELGPAVIGTAAAVVAEVAAAAAEQRLRTHVPSAVRRAATDQLQQLLAAAARKGQQQQRQAGLSGPPQAAAAGTSGAAAVPGPTEALSPP